MTTSKALAIVRTGLACPVGLRADTAWAAMRAGVRRFAAPSGDSDLTVCRLSSVAADASRAERLQALLKHALTDALAVSPPLRGAKSMPVWLAFPETADSASTRSTLRRTCVEHVDALLKVAPELHMLAASSGRAAIFELLGRVQSELPVSGSALGLVCSVDSLVDAHSIAALRAQGLLLNPLQPDGRIPGEAAACFVVAAQGAVQSSQTTALITTLSTEHESESFLSAHAGTSGPMQAHGLTRLFRALAPAFTSRAGVVVSGQSIEGFWGRELAYAYLRNASVMPEPFVHISTAYEIGDAGVAAGAVAIGRAVDVLHPRRTPHGATPRTALVFDVSDAGFIGGAALSQPGAIASTAR